MHQLYLLPLNVRQRGRLARFAGNGRLILILQGKTRSLRNLYEKIITGKGN